MLQDYGYVISGGEDDMGFIHLAQHNILAVLPVNTRWSNGVLTAPQATWPLDNWMQYAYTAHMSCGAP